MSRSMLAEAPGCRTIHAFLALTCMVFASRQRQVSAWPSANEKLQPLLCRVAGKLIQVNFVVPNSHHLSGALMPKALCWMLFSCSSMNTSALVGPGPRICDVLCQH